jgi:hypothetical protein
MCSFYSRLSLDLTAPCLDAVDDDDDDDDDYYYSHRFPRLNS